MYSWKYSRKQVIVHESSRVKDQSFVERPLWPLIGNKARNGMREGVNLGCLRDNLITARQPPAQNATALPKTSEW